MCVDWIGLALIRKAVRSSIWLLATKESAFVAVRSWTTSARTPPGWPFAIRRCVGPTAVNEAFAQIVHGRQASRNQPSVSHSLPAAPTLK